MSFRSISSRTHTGNRLVPGFTLVELMVAVAVLAILATIAAPSFREIIATVRVKGVSTSLYVAVTQARSAAVQRNGRVSIRPANAGDWSQGWQVVVDANNEVLDTQGVMQGVTISGGPAAITFLGNGRIRSNIALPVAISVVSPGVTGIGRCISADASGRPYVKEEACS